MLKGFITDLKFADTKQKLKTNKITSRQWPQETLGFDDEE